MPRPRPLTYAHADVEALILARFAPGVPLLFSDLSHRIGLRPSSFIVKAGLRRLVADGKLLARQVRRTSALSAGGYATSFTATEYLLPECRD